MKEEKMYVPSGLKIVDGKDIMCYTGAFYLKNKEKIDKMLKKCEEILREEEQKSKEFKGKNENIIREETEKYYINQKHDKMFKEMLSDKKSTVDFINSFLHLNLAESNIEKYEKEFRTPEFSNVEADVVYKIKNKNVFILIEHQSSVDYKMSYRIMRYKYAIIESAIDKKRFKEQGYKIPTVIPIVLYTGKRKWKKLSINDIEEIIEGYQENWLEYTLIDANKFSQHGGSDDAQFGSRIHGIGRYTVVQQQIPERDIQQSQTYHYQSHDGSTPEGYLKSFVERGACRVRRACRSICGCFHAQKTG